MVLEPEEETVLAQLATPGLIPELVPGTRIWVRAREPGAAQSEWTALVAQAPNGSLIGLDPTLVQPLVAQAIGEGSIPAFEGYTVSRERIPFGTSRFDFELTNLVGQRAYLEAKAVTLVENGVALFPHAPNQRATRQMRSLARLAAQGQIGAAVIFIVLRIDAQMVMPARHIDAEFTDALRDAEAAGVRLIARRTQLTLEELVMGVPLEVRIPPPAAPR